MESHEMNRRQDLLAGGLGALSLGMPGSVFGTDQMDKRGNAVASRKSCIFALLCGGPSHVDTWDMHGGNMGMGNAFGNGSYGMGFCLPRLDQTLSALLNDLNDRGMIDDTLVVVTGEFGRTPKVLTQQPPGRQHWPAVFSSIMAGAGIAKGQVYGKSDPHGARVVHNRVRPKEFAATIYHALDIPLNEPLNNTGLSRPITTGKPIMELFG